MLAFAASAMPLSYAPAQESVMRIESAPPELIVRVRGKGVFKPNVSTSCLPRSVKSMLHDISAKFGSITVISAYRPGARVAGSGRPSYHASCRAVDFHPKPGTYQRVLAYLRANWNGGVGTYSGRMYHLHIDDGPKIKFHTHVGRTFYPTKRRYSHHGRGR